MLSGSLCRIKDTTKAQAIKPTPGQTKTRLYQPLQGLLPLIAGLWALAKAHGDNREMLEDALRPVPEVLPWMWEIPGCAYDNVADRSLLEFEDDMFAV